MADFAWIGARSKRNPQFCNRAECDGHGSISTTGKIVSTISNGFQFFIFSIQVNRKYYLRDDVLLPLGIREINENGVNSAAELLKKAKALSFVKSSNRHHGPRSEQYRQLFDSASRKGRIITTVLCSCFIFQKNLMEPSTCSDVFLNWIWSMYSKPSAPG